MNKEKSILHQVLTHVGAVVVFLAITMIYFSPVYQGKVLQQSDVQQYIGASQEGREYNQKEGGSSAWTSMFSGMPAYQIAVFGGSPNFLEYIEKPFKALGSNSAGPVFMGMLMAYLMFCLMGYKPSISIVGAIAYSLSSYNIIILDAGHITKAWAIAYMPLVVAGLISIYKQKILLGSIIMALGLALEIKSNHLQMTYYLAIFCAILHIGFLIFAIKNAEVKLFFKVSGILAAVVAVAVLCNVSNFYSNFEMSRESTRGKSELSKPSSSEKQSEGLDKDYVFGWSYGKAETFSLLIPNINGGASGGNLGKSSHLARAIKAENPSALIPEEGINSHTYWGDQPFTSGPVYLGAIICFLFVMGMVLIRRNTKWVLLGATIFFIFLAWGRNMEWFNDFFFYHFPLYSKFRAVSSALVIPALSVVMIAIWGLKEFFEEDIDKKKRKNALIIATSLTGGIALLLWLVPSFGFNFTSPNDASWTSQQPEWYYKALLLDRKDLLSSDALRSLIFILLAAGVLWFCQSTKMERNKLLIAGPLAIALLVLIDLWGVDTRYLNDDNFEDKKEYHAQSFSLTNADQFIKEDIMPSYRVLNVSVRTVNGRTMAIDPFADATTSYYHKSIGGYHAAKLKRYQELIDARLRRESSFLQSTAIRQLNNQVALYQAALARGEEYDFRQIPGLVQDSVGPLFAATTMLNSLNTKYVIYHPELPPVINPLAFGNGWFVDEYRFVDNADEELVSLEELNTLETAVIDKRFENELAGLKIIPDSTSTITLVEFKPDELNYISETKSEQLLVFSEIYYANGWQAYIDGQPAPHFRADWILRAMRVPAGEHKIQFKFEPQYYNLCRWITTISTGLLIILLIGMLISRLPRKNRLREEE